MEKSNINYYCAYWSGLGAIWKGNEVESNDGCGDGMWNRDQGITKGTGWWAGSGKGGGGGKGGKDEKGGGGGYKIPIPSIGKGGGGKGGGNGKIKNFSMGGKETNDGKGDSGRTVKKYFYSSRNGVDS